MTSRVLLPVLRERIDTELRLADAIELVPTTGSDPRNERLGAVRVDLVCRYGADLAAEGAEAWRIVADVVREALGDDPAFDPERDVRVRVVDVASGDPHAD